NPQILIDAVEHGAKGMIVIFDNRRMAAIGALQRAQYGKEYRANDGVAVDYVRLASSVSGVRAAFGGYDKGSLLNALKEVHDPDRLSVLHVPVYSGDHPMAGLGAWGQWNVGNWCDTVQAEWLKSGL
ncbi:MAG: thiamine pyrophosphate-binding protein, partial [Bradyrhizobiaceae bacterium]